MIGILGFVILGLGAAIALAGVPRIRKPNVDPALFDRGLDGAARLACAACGAAPLTMLAVAYAGFFKLPMLLALVVVPAYGAMAFLGMLLPNVGRRVVTGFLAGIVAVLVYDLTRLALSYSQGGGDPIPHIGTMLIGSGAPWWLGYAWRTLGNGAGLGVVFAMLCPRKWWRPATGLLYASFVGLGMILTLWLFPQSQDQLFRLTWQTFVNSCLGHGTYGLVLGLMCRAAVRREARRAGSTRRHAMPDEVSSADPGARPRHRPGREEATTRFQAGTPTSGAGAGLAPRTAAAAPEGGPPSWARPEDVPTEMLPLVPSVPPPSPRRHARGSHSR